MMRIVAVALTLGLAACVTQNPDQSPEQRLQAKCSTFYEALDDVLVYDLSLATLERLQDAEAAADALCRAGGPALEGLTVQDALTAIERRLAQVVEARQEAGR